MNNSETQCIIGIEHLVGKDIHTYRSLLDCHEKYNLSNEVLNFFVTLNNEEINRRILCYTVIMKYDKFIELVDILDPQRKYYHVLSIVCREYGYAIKKEGLDLAREKYHERFLYAIDLYRHTIKAELYTYCSESYLTIMDYNKDFYLQLLPHAYVVHELVIKAEIIKVHYILLYLFMYGTCSPQSVLDTIEAKAKLEGLNISREEAKKGYTLIFDDV